MHISKAVLFSICNPCSMYLKLPENVHLWGTHINGKKCYLAPTYLKLLMTSFGRIPLPSSDLEL